MTFLEIRDRLLSIQGPDVAAAAEHVRRVEAMAARQFKQCHDEGKPGIFQRFAADYFPGPERPWAAHETEQNWSVFWLKIRVAVRDLDPVLPPAALIGGATILHEGPEEAQVGSAVGRQIVYRDVDWQSRARDDADICKILAELAGETEALTGRQGVERIEDPISVSWIRSVTTQKIVKGDSSKLTRWLRCRNCRLAKIARKMYVERADAIRAFSRYPSVRERIKRYPDDEN